MIRFTDMVESGHEKPKVLQLGERRPIAEALPYFIELWDGDARQVEKVLARAASAPLARAIFDSARTEYPDRQITIRRGRRTLARSQEHG